MCCFFPTSSRSWIENPKPGGMPTTVKRLLAVFRLASSGLLTVELQAALSMPHFFRDHMVLPRERAAAVWGQANPNASVTNTFKGNTASAKATRATLSQAASKGHGLPRLRAGLTAISPTSLHSLAPNRAMEKFMKQTRTQPPRAGCGKSDRPDR
jgi:hypothetical protein